jgi:putative ABC transport system permease protein
MAFKNLGRNWRRNSATASAVVLGYAGLLLLNGFVSHIEKFTRATSIYLNHVGSVSVFRKDAVEHHLLNPKKFGLSSAEQEHIEQIASKLFPENEGIGRYLEGFTLMGNGCKTWPVKIRGVPTSLEKMTVQHSRVQQFASELISNRRGQELWQFKKIIPVLVTDKVARNLGKKAIREKDLAVESGSLTSPAPECGSADWLMQTSRDPNVQVAGRTYQNELSAMDAEIIGYYKSGLELLEESAALVPLRGLQQLFETDNVTYMNVYLPWDTPAEPAAEKLSNALKEEGLDVEVFHYKNFAVNPFYAGFMNLIYVMSSFFLALAVGVVTLTVSDTMTMSVLERSREIGTLRAIGFRKRLITRIFAQEASFLSLLSLPVGLLLALLVSWAVNTAGILFEIPGVATQIKVVIEIGSADSLLLALMLVGLTAFIGWLVSVRTSRKQVVTLLQSHVS